MKGFIIGRPSASVDSGARLNEMSIRKQNCPVVGCNLELETVSPRPLVEALSTSARGCIRKPLAVARIYDGTCPEHGRVAVSRRGHHIDPEKEGEDTAVIFLADEPWQGPAFEVSQLYRKPTT